jgi:hypothetical protein
MRQLAHNAMSARLPALVGDCSIPADCPAIRPQQAVIAIVGDVVLYPSNQCPR